MATKPCKQCGHQVGDGAQACPQCGAPTSEANDWVAGLLALFLGPVGLWYKGHYAAGFAWLVVAVISGVGIGVVGWLLFPVFWLGMIIHAAAATPK